MPSEEYSLVNKSLVKKRIRNVYVYMLLNISG